MENKINHYPGTKTISELLEYYKQKKLIIPSFQRNLVWDTKKRRGLIDSIINGYPIGSILFLKLSDSKNENENDKFKIIDGLQRISSIIYISVNPFVNFSWKEDIKNYPTRNEALGTEDHLKKIFEKWGFKKEFKSFKSYLEFKLWEQGWNLNKIAKGSISLEKFLRQEIYEKNEIFKSNDNPNNPNQLKLEFITEINNALESPIEHILEIPKLINDFKIPIIFCYGQTSKKLMSEVFKRINKGGVPLNKYEIIAASWDDFDLCFNLIKLPLKEKIFLEKITKNVIKKYQDFLKVKELGIKFAENDKNIDETINKGSITLFEIFFGFAKLIQEEYSRIFEIEEKHKNSTQIYEPVFDLINVCLGNKMSEIENLDKFLRESGVFDFSNKETMSLQILRLLMMIYDCIFEADKLLFKNNLIERKFNSKDNTAESRYIKPSQNQLNALILEIFNINFAMFKNISKDTNKEALIKEIDLESNKAVMVDAFKNYSRHYIKEVLDDYWSSSTSSKLEKHNNKYCVYNKPISSDELKISISNYISKSENNPDGMVESKRLITKASAILLSIIFGENFVVNDLNIRNFEIDHIIPIAWARKKSLGMKLSKSINSFLNLALINSEINGAKKDMLFNDKDFVNKIISESKFNFMNLENYDDYLQKTTLMNLNDFNEIKIDKCDDFEVQDYYVKFLNTRRARVLDYIIETIDKRYPL